MPLRNLASMKGFQGFGREPTANVGPSKALIFVLDAGYLLPLKVMLHSLAAEGDLVDLPIIIASEDASLFEDPVVHAVADIPHVFDDATRSRFEATAKNARRRKDKDAWTRATFQKWVSFRDWGFDELLFLDCDMIATGNLAPIFEHSGDVVGSPQFQTTLTRDEAKERRPRGETRTMLEDFVWSLGSSRLSLNSGVMVLRRKVLSENFLSDLIDFTSTRACVNEQQYITQFTMSDQTSATLNLISPLYNFQDSFLKLATLHRQLELLRQMRVLHFAGAHKPWAKGPSKKSSIGHLMWWRAFHDASEYMML